MDDPTPHLPDADPFLRPASPASSISSHDAVEHALPSRTSSPPLSRPSSPEHEHEHHTHAHDEDAPQCRICFGGAEDAPELGRLIRPCMCKGTVSYVHVKCLNEWRAASRNKTSYWSCLQCGYKYHFARTRVAGLATNPFILALATLLLFFALTLLAGFLTSLLLPTTSAAPTTPTPQEPTPKSRLSTILSYLTGDDDEDDDADDLNDPFNGYYYDELDRAGGVFYLYTPAGAVQDVVRAGIRAFASGDATALLWRLLGHEPADPPAPDPPASILSTTGFKQTLRLLPTPPAPPPPPPQTIMSALARQFMLGLSAVGIVSFVSLLLSFSLLLPVQMGLRTFSWRGRRESGSSAGTILILVFVAIGVFRAIYKVYTLTRTLAGYLLLRAETAILDVSPADAALASHQSTHALLPRLKRQARAYKLWAGSLLRFDRRAWAGVGRWWWRVGERAVGLAMPLFWPQQV